MNAPTRRPVWNEYQQPHQDLREFLSRIERAGELLKVPGAHWNLEMGTLAESVNERPDAPAVLFEDVPGYPRGYRVMVHDAKRVGIWMSPGKHGRQIREKYFMQGKPCPVLVSCGHDPLLFLAGGNELRFGLSEYDYAGGHRGEPFEVIESELYRL